MEQTDFLRCLLANDGVWWVKNTDLSGKIDTGLWLTTHCSHQSLF